MHSTAIEVGIFLWGSPIQEAVLRALELAEVLEYHLRILKILNSLVAASAQPTVPCRKDAKIEEQW